MGSYHEVFVECADGVPHERLLADVGAACGAALLPVEADHSDWGVKVGGTAFWLSFSHAFEEDAGIPFERYDAYLDVKDSDGDLVRQEATARRVYDALAATGRYRLALTHDLQRLIAATDLPRAT
ncbi:hypothetical protein ABTX81_03995 [Kitasatospora sp. NPDC097605]|uniref:hypothetical protein n=1 Tax=Kitasatospora sp. NPDC097605 TaxID=3157226 RepID=UPI0033272E8E